MQNIGNGVSLKKKINHAQETENALRAGIYAWIDDNKDLVLIAQRLSGLTLNLGLCDTNAHNPFQIVPTDLFAENGVVGLPADAELWDRCAKHILTHNLKSTLINSVTCNHVNEGFERN